MTEINGLRLAYRGFVAGLAGLQAVGALLGMTFAYFFGRFFTVRRTLIVAGPAFALLSWGLVGAAVAPDAGLAAFATHPIPALASVAYGLLLGADVPVRGEVARYAGSPST